MKHFTLLIWLLPVTVLAQKEDAALLKRIQGYEQQLADAVATGDTNVWKKYVHDNCIITTEDGSVITRSQMLAELRPLPPGVCRQNNHHSTEAHTLWKYRRIQFCG